MNIAMLTENRHNSDSNLSIENCVFATSFRATPSSSREKKNVADSSRSMSSFPDYVAKFRSKMVEIRSSFRKTARMGLYDDYWVPPSIQPTSSSTPSVPLSNSELLYGGTGEGSGRPHPGGQSHGSEEVASGDLGAWDHRTHDKQKLKELELHGNKRPPSRSSSSRKIPNFDKVSFDRDREELRPLANSLAPTKQSPLRANGIKNNLLRADQFLSQRANGATGRDEDLVAMGTLWSPSQLQTRGSGTTTTTNTSSGKSTSAPNSGSGGAYTSSNSLPVRRPINMSTGTSTKQLLHHTHNSGSFNNSLRAPKEVEPKYSDPLSGASPTFQQRLMELAALEAETVRWERTKKIKKKPKQDRDS